MSTRSHQLMTKPKIVSREEIWDAMEQDTRDFISALCAPFEATEIVEEKRKDNPKPVKVEKKVTRQISLKAVKLVEKNLFWKK